MRNIETLRRIFAQLNGRGYALYKQLTGSYRINTIRLVVDYVQANPCIPPSWMRIIIDREVASLPANLTGDAAGRTAISDSPIRRFADAAHRMVPGPEGAGDSGFVGIGRPGQEILERTSAVVLVDRVEVRIDIGLPASGRRTHGRQAARLLIGLLLRVIEASLLHQNLSRRALRKHVTLLRGQEHLRELLSGRGLATFVGDGAVLPRRSGDSDLPLIGEVIAPFESPGNLRATLDLPSGRRVTGMGVPEGVTVIVGGGYHGKSTLLRAIERSVYPHIGDDGREWITTHPGTVTIRAESGRAVIDMDISPFIISLPSGADTRCFNATNVSGSTSQAASPVEAVEAGAPTLLIDEDTSATSFIIRDERMHAPTLVAQEPITPFMDRTRLLYGELRTSTVLVAGDSGVFFEVADHVIAINHHVPVDAAEEAHEIAAAPPSIEATEAFNGLRAGRLEVVSLPLSDTGKSAKARSRTRI